MSQSCLWDCAWIDCLFCCVVLKSLFWLFWLVFWLAWGGCLVCLEFWIFLDFWFPIHNPNPGPGNIVILHPYQKVILHPYQLPFLLRKWKDLRRLVGRDPALAVAASPSSSFRMPLHSRRPRVEGSVWRSCRCHGSWRLPRLATWSSSTVCWLSARRAVLGVLKGIGRTIPATRPPHER